MIRQVENITPPTPGGPPVLADYADEVGCYRQLAEQLQQALVSRLVIEQAKGVLSAHYGTDIDHAFELLRRHARSHNASIHDVASAVVHLGLRPADDTRPA